MLLRDKGTTVDCWGMMYCRVVVITVLFKSNQPGAVDYIYTHTITPTLLPESGFTKRLHQLQNIAAEWA